MKIVVYGLGVRGQEFIRDIQDEIYSVEIVAVTDTFIGVTDFNIKNNYIYISPSSICNYEYDFIIVTPEKYFYEIEKGLFERGVSKEKIKSLKEFEEERKNFYCNLCGNKIFAWRYIGEDYEIFHNINIVGAGKRRGGCAVCGSSDRARFVYYVMNNFTRIFDGNVYDVLHFAPENAISNKLRTMNSSHYISGDIESGRADVIADITKLQFEDNQFDYIICNHVMEHISAEQKAFSEIKRCLQAEGVLIFTAPVCWTQKTYENKNITSDQDRIKYYGQKDHVRLYGNDIVERIEKYGFEVQLLRCNEICNEEERKRLGFLRDDTVLLCKKRDE